jgi:hypothetical protein
VHDATPDPLATPGRRARSCDCGHTLPRGSSRPYNVAATPGSRIFCGGDFSISGDRKTWRKLYAPPAAILRIGGVQLGPVKHHLAAAPVAAIAADWLGVGTGAGTA